ncbi:MAG: alpha-D-ribose 1-methylphosphonate 5-triphosphate diphosphatase [Pseudomonadota bacterium]
MRPISLTVTGVQVLRPNGFSDEPVSLADGIITDAPQSRQVDLTGFQVLPGIVDLHGDGFERHLAPRRGLVQDKSKGLLALDSELAACGITTAVLAQFWSWEGGMRRPPFAKALAQALDATRPRLFTDMHLQLRFETHLLEDYPEVLAFVADAGIRYVVFNDHVPHAHVEAGKRPPRLTGQALKSGRSPEAHLQLIKDLHARRNDVPAALDGLATALSGQGVRLGSHDDPDVATRAAMRARGVDIAEFPETVETAQAARDAGDPIILGAPNVVRGGSHAGKQSAADAVLAGLADCLVSDYHYASLQQSVDILADRMEGGLAAAWELVSKRPAEIMGWSDRGTISPGKRADLVIRNPEGRVEATFVAGRIAHCAGEVAARLLG